MSIAQLQVRQDGWWRQGQAGFPSLATTSPRLHPDTLATSSRTPGSMSTPRGTSTGRQSFPGGNGHGSSTVRHRIAHCKGVEGMHAALSRIVHQGHGHDPIQERDVVAASKQAILTPRRQDVEAEDGYMGRRLGHREMTLKQYGRNIDKHLRLIKSRPVTDLNRYIPTLDEMGWAPSPKTRHEQNALDLTRTEGQHKNFAMAAPPSVTSSSSSNVSISRTSSARNRYANNVKNTLR